MKYLLVVGEASGDLHASNLITAIKALDSEAEFRFMGGDLMAKASGIPPLVHYRDLAFMGFLPILMNYPKIKQAGRIIQSTLRDFSPDVVIPVDYASFNLRYVLPYAHELGIPIVYYIAPKLWAWKQWRIKKLRQWVDLLLCILPFEERFFTDRGVRSLYVGNPSVDTTAPILRAFKTDGRTNQIAILSGSRRQELRSNLSVMLDATQSFSDRYKIVVAGAPGLTKEDYMPYLKNYAGVELRFGETYETLSQSKVALVTSGTATLETALLGTPLVVCYRMSGQCWARWVWSHCFSVPYISLVNLILKHPTVPELIGGEVTADTVKKHLENLLTEGESRSKQIAAFEKLRQVLGNEGTSGRVAQAIVHYIKKKTIES